MKGIILHGGHGTRLRPLTHTGPKQLLPIANKPMSQYALDDLRKSGIKEIAIVVGGARSEKVKEYYGDGKKFDVKITYIEQDKPKGISHAIDLCKDFISEEKFVVYLGDNILKESLSEHVQEFEKSKSDATIFLTPVDNPTRFGIAEIKDKKIIKIVEKPKEPTSNLAVIGVYFFTPKIFEMIKKLKPSWRGELEVTDALQLLLDNNYKIDFVETKDWWKDTGTPEDILHANQLVLDSIISQEKHTNNDSSQLSKKIIVGKNCILTRDSTITGPVIIGNDCVIGHGARIGPYVSVGDHCNLENCEIVNSIIMHHCKINLKNTIEDSIIATGSEISESKNHSKNQFLLGERSKLTI